MDCLNLSYRGGSFVHSPAGLISPAFFIVSHVSFLVFDLYICLRVRRLAFAHLWLSLALTTIGSASAYSLKTFHPELLSVCVPALPLLSLSHLLRPVLPIRTPCSFFLFLLFDFRTLAIYISFVLVGWYSPFSVLSMICMSCLFTLTLLLSLAIPYFET